MNVFDKIMRIPGNKYREKDAKKFAGITKFIGRGSWVSSTHKYAQVLNGIANTGEYELYDVVGISVEGNRKNRLTFNKNEILAAIKAEVAFITDKPSDRTRPYNIGEREVAAFLQEHGYQEIEADGFWQLV